MIDAGTGVGRLIEHPKLLDGVTQLDIVLTHFHLDHIVGLAYLPALGACEHTTLWGPGALLYGTSTHAVLDPVSHQPFHPVPLEQQQIEVRDLPAGELELAGVRLMTRRQDRHSAPSLGLRFDDQLAWITDTAYDPGSGPFASGCKVLAHEAWFTTAAPRNPDIHSSAAQAAQVAAQAGAEQLLMIHLPPFTQSIDPLMLEAQASSPSVLAAHDGLSLTELGG
jgi:ribonuclease BN (tRNA processing enzyme)